MKRIIIYNAIIWAIVMLATAYLFVSQGDNFNLLLMVLIFGFISTNGLLISFGKKIKEK